MFLWPPLAGKGYRGRTLSGLLISVPSMASHSLLGGRQREKSENM